MKTTEQARRTTPHKIRTATWAFGLNRTAAALLMMGAGQVAMAQVPVNDLAATAPASYTVVQGDTLWGISGKFLKSPWQWPQLWKLNQGGIKDPHWIYPGHVLKLERVNGQATLHIDPSSASVAGELRIKPGVRFEDAVQGDDGIATVSLQAMTHFLKRPMLVDTVTFSSSPRVLAVESGRIFAGPGTKIYGAGLSEQASGDFMIYREGTPLIDPDTQEILGYEAIDLGTVRVLRNGETSLLEVVSSNQEVARGDRLLPISSAKILKVDVQPPPADLAARVMKVYDGKSGSMLTETGMTLRAYAREGGPLSIVILNKGVSSGLLEGQVVKLDSTGQTVGRPSTLGYINGQKAADPIKLPNEFNGHAVVFKSFERVSYALVMKASRPIMGGDSVGAP